MRRGPQAVELASNYNIILIVLFFVLIKYAFRCYAAGMAGSGDWERNGFYRRQTSRRSSDVK